MVSSVPSGDRHDLGVLACADPEFELADELVDHIHPPDLATIDELRALGTNQPYQRRRLVQDGRREDQIGFAAIVQHLGAVPSLAVGSGCCEGIADMVALWLAASGNEGRAFGDGWAWRWRGVGPLHCPRGRVLDTHHASGSTCAGWW